MATAHQTSESILSNVARHEQELMAKIDASVAQAKDIVERARAEARKHLMTEEARLGQDIARIRAEADAARQRDFEATINAAQQRLESVKAEALRRAPATAEAVMKLFMPNSTGEN